MVDADTNQRWHPRSPDGGTPMDVPGGIPDGTLITIDERMVVPWCTSMCTSMCTV
jgi:hypothetical protein